MTSDTSVGAAQVMMSHGPSSSITMKSGTRNIEVETTNSGIYTDDFNDASIYGMPSSSSTCDPPFVNYRKEDGSVIALKPIVIAVVGGSGSGKSYLVHQLKERIEYYLNNHLSVDKRLAVTEIYHDMYYYGRDENGNPIAQTTNYDIPAALDNEEFALNVREILAGKTTSIPVYDFTVSDRKKERDILPYCPVVIVEGILVGAVEEVRSMCDYMVFINCTKEDRLSRRIARDTVERGRTVESVIKQFEAEVSPAHDEYVQPFMYHTTPNHVIDTSACHKTSKAYTDFIEYEAKYAVDLAILKAGLDMELLGTY